MARRRRQIEWSGVDEVGMAISGLCLLHCLILPVAVVFVPELAALAPLHRLLGLMALLLALLTLLPAYDAHRNTAVLALTLLGASCLATSCMAVADCCSTVLAWCSGAIPASEVSLTAVIRYVVAPVGMLLLIASHAMNRSIGFQSPSGSRLRRRS
ncbi:MerC family mercury resistance protein [Maioricimonas rarisocia]|nr:MerC family mercury resistance protein [Maioricimonas rarisocia]